MRIILKIIAAPIVGLLALVVSICSFLLVVAGTICWVLCVLVTLLGILAFISGQLAGGIVFLIIAYLISPYGLPTFAAWLVGKLEALRYTIQYYVYD